MVNVINYHQNDIKGFSPNTIDNPQKLENFVLQFSEFDYDYMFNHIENQWKMTWLTTAIRYGFVDTIEFILPKIV